MEEKSSSSNKKRLIQFIIVVLIIIFTIGCSVGGSYFLILWQNDQSALGFDNDNYIDNHEDYNNILTRLETLEEFLQEVAVIEADGSRVIIELDSSLYQQLSMLTSHIYSLEQQTNDKLNDFQERLDSSFKRSTTDVTYVDRRLQVSNLILKSSGEVLKAKLDISNRNFGRAKNELEIALNTLTEVSNLSYEMIEVKLINDLLTLVNDCMYDLELNRPTTLDRIELLWHELCYLLQILSTE